MLFAHLHFLKIPNPAQWHFLQAVPPHLTRLFSPSWALRANVEGLTCFPHLSTPQDGQPLEAKEQFRLNALPHPLGPSRISHVVVAHSKSHDCVHPISPATATRGRQDVSAGGGPATVAEVCRKSRESRGPKWLPLT